jgi:hypothetical protein
MATRTGLSAYIPVNCGVPVEGKEWKSSDQRVLLATVQPEAPSEPCRSGRRSRPPNGSIRPLSDIRAE